jgi:N-acetyl-anhydromuramyl-L-alanine amidase AmpD/murein DD-endopeptidase MepM/ murein hydrolase activator NlpD
VVAGQSFDVGRPVVLWSDRERGFDGYARGCIEGSRAEAACCAPYQPHYRPRPPGQRTLAQLQRKIRLIVLHHDGCANSRSCFYLMHDGCKKLSAHFMIDNDGTIYQTLDLAEVAYHARLANDFSIGIELANLARTDGSRLPPDYAGRPRLTVQVKGDQIEAFDFRPEQYDSVIALTRTLLGIFPRIPAQVPLGADNKPTLDFLKDRRRWTGIVGHVHVEDVTGKWDPGAFRWLEFLDALTGVYLPLEIDGLERFPVDDPGWGSRVAQVVFAMVEQRASAQFPVQPGGLMHAGVNLRGQPGAPVRAPTAGVIVAARLGSSDGSSTSFVLIRHQVAIGDRPLTFHSLLYHLDPGALSRPPPWLRRLGPVPEALRRGEIALLDQPVAAGETVGYLGRVRRGLEQGPELRFEIFTGTAPDPGESFFSTIDAARDGPFLRSPALSALLNLQGQAPDDRALRRFFREDRRLLPRRRLLRALAVRHVHEWSSRLDERAYQDAPELAALAAAERRQLYQRAVAPYVFLTPPLARHAGLPADLVVWSYNPIAFLEWLAARRGGTNLRPPPPAGPDTVAEAPPPAARREPWMAYLQPPAVPEPPAFYQRLVEIPVHLKRREEIPLVPSAR